MSNVKRRGNLLLALAFAFFIACFSMSVVDQADARRASCKACGGVSGSQDCYNVTIGYHWCYHTVSGYCIDGDYCP